MRILLAAALLTSAAPIAAQTSDQSSAVPAPVLTTPDAKDVWTYAQPEIARVTHVGLDLDVDFDSRTLSGHATLDIQAQPDAGEIILDSDNLNISAVTNGEGRPLNWSVGARDDALGAPLTIELDGSRQIVITYRTKPGASALQWLPPEMTAGKKKPYLFSQGQPINNRSWIPTQDSPGIRQTWDASLTVPGDLVAVMSAEKLSGETGELLPDGRRRFRFRMDKAVPPYLIAFAVGDLQFKSLGPRSGVWTEASMLDAAAYEFADVEKMIDAASDLYGPYRWGRYDMLVLPPSFPFGGMENPTLTFLTPTIITGDRSNTDVVAHELAHSWSGNLVTNATWSDSWLNEGFTTYFENRIMEALYGEERAAMYSDLDWDGMMADLEVYGGPTGTGAATRLHGDPGATGGQLDYFKGSNFLRMLEKTVGRERWDAYLRSYFDRHAFQPQTTAGFLTDLRQNLLKDDADLELSMQLDRWAYAAGLPDNAVHIQSETLAEVDRDLAAYNAGGVAADVDTQGWSTQEWLRFLNGIPREQTEARLQDLDEALGLSDSSNAYVRSAWLELAIANRYQAAVPSLTEFATRVGRGLLIRPLYSGLMEQGEWGRDLARQLYSEAKPTYHPATAAGIEAIIEVK
ncbi:M1 family metallopeptidase [Altericroceibacterium endophyticum]|uniref:Aminopeptidase N n=1 Tax=Altericroceibacterium endophyticum TaxID=1808508 RepID=A0A6I4SZV0_9SPHN|nr:M1 family metallopeptidase [Altericroceibacterium endophyticum]MXO64146.1 aminopeptidase [Altericroceibacterium endophyticum]